MSRPYLSIYEAATTCWQRLQQSVDSSDFPALAHDDWARKRLADFNLWASGSGALAKQRTLDLRLASQSQAKEVVINLLSLLEIYLDQCQNIAKQARVFKKNDPEPPKDKASEEYMTSARIDEVALAQLRNELTGVEVMINQLVRISIAIYRSGTRARLERADQTFVTNRHCELRDHLSLLIYASTLTEEQKIAGKNSLHLDPNSLTDIQSRLIDANLRRRHRFLYAQRRSKQQRKDSSRDQREQEHIEAQTTSTSTVELEDPSPSSGKERRPQQQAALAQSVKSPVPYTSTNSSLTAFDGPIEIPMGERLSMMVPSSTGAKIGYPRARKVPGRDLFTCPCCCQSLPVHISSGLQWRKHLSEDISPYTCILPNCPRPQELYSSRTNWMDHMLKDHPSSQYWLCLACPEPSKFSKEIEFAQHLMSQHCDTVNADEIPFFISECTCTAPLEITSCPLCPPSPAGNNTQEAGAVLDEIAKHIHSFSLNALPWPVPDGKEREYLGWEENDELIYFDIGSDHGSLDKIQPSISEVSEIDFDTERLSETDFEDPGPDPELAESIQSFAGQWDNVYATSTRRGDRLELEDDRTMQRFIKTYKLKEQNQAKDQQISSDEEDEPLTENELLLKTTRKGYVAALKLLLQKGRADIDCRDDWGGQTSLSWAARYGHTEAVLVLIKNGANIECKDNSGQTPLSWAAENGHDSVVKLLLEAGADIETKDDGNGQTPLSFAARKGRKAIVKLLLQSGANIESKDDHYGQTPILWAAENGHEEVLKLLLEAGADIEAKDDRYGRTPLSWAVEKGHTGIVNLLEELNGKL